MRVRAIALSIALALVLPAVAQAHATLDETTPQRGASLQSSPPQVVLRFSESVETALGAVRVYDQNGREVQVGAPVHPNGDGSKVAARLRGGLPDGGYTVTYRVISADSHPVSGGFTFGVGTGAAAAGSVADRLAGQDSGPVTSTAFSAVRAVQFAAITLAIGVLAILALAWLPALRAVGGAGERWRASADAFARRSRLLLLGAGVAGVVSALLALPLEAAEATGSPMWSAIGDSADVLDTRFGLVWGLGALVWVLVLALTAGRATVPTLRPATVGATGLAAPGGRLARLVAPVLALAFLPALGGHASVQDPVAILLPANVVHVMAAGAWIGGIAVLVLALPAATRAIDVPERTQLLAGTIGRFSTLALVAVAALLTGGIVQSRFELGAPDDLLDTAFGRAVLIKIGLVLALLALGAVNRRRNVPALERAAANAEGSGTAGMLLRRTLRAELALGVAALAVTGALAGYPPADTAMPGPYSGAADIGPARAELTVDPARPGVNEAHLYFFDREDGRQWTAPKEVTVRAVPPVAGAPPLALDARKAGPGHYVIGGAALSPKGEWRLEVTARVSDFDEFRTTFQVPIR